MGITGTNSIGQVQREITVGIIQGRSEIYFKLEGNYTEGGKPLPSGVYTAVADGDEIVMGGERRREFLFAAQTSNSRFMLYAVTIGIGFHWQRDENQIFKGNLKLTVRRGLLTAINVIGIEDYLQSVISSEMSPTAGMEFMKAHAVISRSWLLAQLGRKSLAGRYVQQMVAQNPSSPACAEAAPSTLIRWQDREDHEDFDLCADDHCQRYQGITKWTDLDPDGEGLCERVRDVIESTWGEVLTHGGEICDARFSKCCGGAMEEYRYCWDDKDVPYLRYGRDFGTGSPHNLTIEEEAREWIMAAPRSYCNTRNATLLRKVLNGFDQDTIDFYRWQVAYSAEELRDIIRERTGEDYGEILDLVPEARGRSGRIWKLTIKGSLKSRTIGKELEIRRTLSRTHLYSSAFVVTKEYASDSEVPSRFILDGAGWGHGVGLCQIGAAVMCDLGKNYHEILAHYYPGTSLDKIY